MIDSTDKQILKILQEDARTSNAEIARQVGKAPSAVLERVRKLEKCGVIAGYETRVDPRQVELGLLAFVQVKTEEPAAEQTAGLALAALPEVQEVHHIAGEDCYLAKVRAASPDALGCFLRKSIGTIPEVVSTRTTVVMGTLKETGQLPMPEGEDS